MATGNINTGSLGRTPSWVYVDLPPGVQLVQGKNYRLWFASPKSNNTKNCYFQSIPYGESSPAVWLEAGWGGMANCYTAGQGSKWTTLATSDLSFSLQVPQGLAMLPDIVAPATGPTGAVVRLTTPQVSDTADPAPVVTNNAPAIFPIGTTIVTWTVKDAAGNSATTTQRVIVVQ